MGILIEISGLSVENLVGSVEKRIPKVFFAPFLWDVTAALSFCAFGKRKQELENNYDENDEPKGISEKDGLSS